MTTKFEFYLHLVLFSVFLSLVCNSALFWSKSNQSHRCSIRFDLRSSSMCRIIWTLLSYCRMNLPLDATKFVL
ncbi:hypothetical protein K469DRAFT_369125 [Zopfia rhizophila CBS 207.26]|uniref:Uncharacterized protein n=1 Tax=Zopfia rhizophila CBS 207.26 TaxID=1314779 RepID=A0A6A6EJX6_9PEZI|nr:hypothetical protein K469DRAFT_369125 [Zopfia rhizophila CBS 207.26]